ncbi:MAG: DUF2283 domain-containing protein [Calditrichaeota bacterium]|nr:DUF2283 domain-containing protein [Calditrichota bacterium]
MQVHYNAKTDLLYIAFNDRDQQVLNKEISEDVIIDIGDNDKIVGIEVINASKRLNLQELLPVQFRQTAESV